MELIATCAFGLEKLLYQEIKKLDLWVVKTEDGRVIFEGQQEDIIRTNLWLRTAERIYIKLAEFPAYTFDELFDQTFDLAWPEILPESATFPVLCSTSNSALHNEPSIQSIVKKAIVKKLQTVRPENPLPETGPTYSILTRFNKDICTIALDTTGDSLHKRGYRQQANLAPIKETLAAALVMLSDWTPEKILVDPFCGSGTILIEAAMIAQNIAPGLNRNFSYERWHDFDPKVTQKIFAEAAEQIKKLPLQIYGYDLDRQVIYIAKDNAERAGVTINFEQSDVHDLDFEKMADMTIITNPPYGERLSEVEDVETLYRDLGALYAQTKNCSLYLIASHPDFQQIFGHQATKNRKLFNGKIKCYLYQYPSVNK